MTQTADLHDHLNLDAETQALLFREARTVNAFSDEPVRDEEIAAAYDFVRWGPTAMNTSPLRVALVRSPEARARLGEHMSSTNKDKTIAAPLTLIAAYDLRFHDHLAELAPERLGLVESFEADPARRESLAKPSALIQVGYLIIGLRAAGLQVGPMAGFDTAGVDADLLAGTSWKSVLVINVGHGVAEGGVRPRGGRLGADQALRSL